jgi:hypothetical protein
VNDVSVRQYRSDIGSNPHYPNTLDHVYPDLRWVQYLNLSRHIQWPRAINNMAISISGQTPRGHEVKVHLLPVDVSTRRLNYVGRIYFRILV